MMRQCAWCLRLIDSTGERVSQWSLPKLYEASHGICGVCGALWLQQVLEPSEEQNAPLKKHNSTVPLQPHHAEPGRPTQHVVHLPLEQQVQHCEQESALAWLPELSNILCVV